MEEGIDYQTARSMDSTQSDTGDKVVMFTARVKVSDKELFQKISEEMGEGVKQADVFSQLLKNQSMINAIGSADPDQKGQVAALQAHVNMISKIFSDMMAGYKAINQETKERYVNDIREKADEIKELKEKVKEATICLKELEEENQSFIKRITEVEGINEIQEKTINDKEEIILARNNSIATLQAQIEELRGLEVENKRLIEDNDFKKKEVINLNAEIKDLKKELERKNQEIEQQNKEHIKALQTLNEKHQEDIEILKQKMDLDKNRSIVEVNAKHQTKINKIHTQYQEKQQELYEKIENKDNLINELKEQLRLQNQ